MPTATRSSTTSRSPIRTRSRRSTPPAAAICSSTTPPGPISARRKQLKKARDRGLDVDHLQETYAKCINKALEAKPADMTITTHVCRGNFRSTFISSGGYEPVAETLARQVQLRRLLPRIRHRPRRRLRAAALPAQGQQDRRARPCHLQAGRGSSSARTSRSASRRRPSSSRSTSSACRRSAASPPPRKATCWPRTSSGRSCAWSSKLANEVWGK